MFHELSLNKDYDKESGFTLIELLVVILIIGVLSAIAIPAFLNQRKEANNAALKSDMKTVATWLETQKIKNPEGSYLRIAKNWTPTNPTTNSSNWPADMKLSEGVGIITSDSGASQMYFGGNASPNGAGFCVEGRALGSDYETTTLWYNSQKGGFTNNCRL